MFLPAGVQFKQIVTGKHCVLAVDKCDQVWGWGNIPHPNNKKPLPGDHNFDELDDFLVKYREPVLFKESWESSDSGNDKR